MADLQAMGTSANDRVFQELSYNYCFAGQHGKCKWPIEHCTQVICAQFVLPEEVVLRD